MKNDKTDDLAPYIDFLNVVYSLEGRHAEAWIEVSRHQMLGGLETILFDNSDLAICIEVCKTEGEMILGREFMSQFSAQKIAQDLKDRKNIPSNLRDLDLIEEQFKPFIDKINSINEMTFEIDSNKYRANNIKIVDIHQAEKIDKIKTVSFEDECDDEYEVEHYDFDESESAPPKMQPNAKDENAQKLKEKLEEQLETAVEAEQISDKVDDIFARVQKIEKLRKNSGLNTDGVKPLKTI